MANDRQAAGRPPVPQVPRLFVNINGDGSRFYYDGSNITIRYFDPITQRYGTFMPPVYEKQTFMCIDGTNFVFYPDGSGSYTSTHGTIPITPGKFSWMPPPPVIIPVPVLQAPPPPRPILQAPSQTVQEEDDDSSDDDGKTHRRWKNGLA